mgnify:CR=1 FL=1
MSTLKADTIVASDGTSPVTLTKQQAVKSWIKSISNGTSIPDSFNVSSTADTATGRQKVAITTAFASTTTICCTSSGQNTSTNNGSGNFNRNAEAVRGDTASEIFVNTMNMSALADVELSQYHAHGDLA